MEKFNRYWMLKYSEHRGQLKCLFTTKEEFLERSLYEVTYPLSYKDFQTRYTCAVDFMDFPEGTIFKKLTRKEKSSLCSYYQLEKGVCYGKKD